ncbi:MAG TPA: type II CAAX endopeptidase family protein [Terriglobales bacterium]|nr:type II CAAX endopeptidase family protein [Terriglobales bacterium]
MSSQAQATTTSFASGPERRSSLPLAAGLYGFLLIAFWFAALHFNMPERIHGHMPSSFTAFSLILAPYWFFGFGLGDVLRRILQNKWLRIFLPGLLVIPYPIFSIPRDEFRIEYATILFSIPVVAAALFEFLPKKGTPEGAKFCWQDFVVLSMFFLPVEFGLLRFAFPYSGLGALPKLILVDAALYSYLVVRNLDRVGYDFRLRVRDFAVGVRELLFYAPIAIGLGLVLHFLRPHTGIPSAAQAFGAVLITYFFVAIPEELFFRGALQNLLEARIGHRSAWIIASVIFGLSHFNKPLPFNWRYVIMGSIAGMFYGRAWRDRRRLAASATAHTMVDVLWSLWFR